MLDAATQVCISIAERPGRIGTALHNAGYRALELNFLYKAFAVRDLQGAIAGVRALGFRGASISMPFKEAVLEYVDDLDEVSRSVGAVNTIVNEAGKLTGFNTDVHGAERALSEIGPLADRTVLVLGAGGASRAVLAALRRLQAGRILLAARNAERAHAVAGRWQADVTPWEGRGDLAVDVIINATPIGMAPLENEMPVPAHLISRASAVMDLVINPLETRMLREARLAGARVVPGYRMAMHQAAAQFELYTRRKAPLDVFEHTLMELLSPAQASCDSAS